MSLFSLSQIVCGETRWEGSSRPVCCDIPLPPCLLSDGIPVSQCDLPTIRLSSSRHKYEANENDSLEKKSLFGFPRSISLSVQQPTRLFFPRGTNITKAQTSRQDLLEDEKLLAEPEDVEMSHCQRSAGLQHLRVAADMSTHFRIIGNLSFRSYNRPEMLIGSNNASCDNSRSEKCSFAEVAESPHKPEAFLARVIAPSAPKNLVDKESHTQDSATGMSHRFAERPKLHNFVCSFRQKTPPSSLALVCGAYWRQTVNLVYKEFGRVGDVFIQEVSALSLLTDYDDFPLSSPLLKFSAALTTFAKMSGPRVLVLVNFDQWCAASSVGREDKDDDGGERGSRFGADKPTNKVLHLRGDHEGSPLGLQTDLRNELQQLMYRLELQFTINPDDQGSVSIIAVCSQCPNKKNDGLFEDLIDLRTPLSVGEREAWLNPYWSVKDHGESQHIGSSEEDFVACCGGLKKRVLRHLRGVSAFGAEHHIDTALLSVAHEMLFSESWDPGIGEKEDGEKNASTNFEAVSPPNLSQTLDNPVSVLRDAGWLRSTMLSRQKLESKMYSSALRRAVNIPCTTKELAERDGDHSLPWGLVRNQAVKQKLTTLARKAHEALDLHMDNQLEAGSDKTLLCDNKVLIVGAGRYGKSTLCAAVRGLTYMHVEKLGLSSILSAYSGETHQNLKNQFILAASKQPVFLVADDLEQLVGTCNLFRIGSEKTCEDPNLRANEYMDEENNAEKDNSENMTVKPLYSSEGEHNQGGSTNFQKEIAAGLADLLDQYCSPTFMFLATSVNTTANLPKLLSGRFTSVLYLNNIH